MTTMTIGCVILLIIVVSNAFVADAFNVSLLRRMHILQQQQRRITVDIETKLSCQTSDNLGFEIFDCVNKNVEKNSRRNVLSAGLTLSAMLLPQLVDAVENSSSSLERILFEIQKARNQMNAVPDLIKSEQWDGIRAILITPPLSDLWTKSARKSSLLQDYADVIGNVPTGDELAVLEAKEDVEGHLRFLDMAVYNNNFNPIKSVGEIGATKALISSYYDDPINEYKATIAALDSLIQLGAVK